jgi:lipoate-protein ligase A
VVCRGKKIIGSAQTRKVSTILQHGSIPVTFSPARVISVLALRSGAARDRLESTLEKKAGGLAEFLQRRPGFGEVCDALVDGLSRCLDIEFVEQGLSEREQRTAQRLLREKYADAGWNQKR